MDQDVNVTGCAGIDYDAGGWVQTEFLDTAFLSVEFIDACGNSLAQNVTPPLVHCHANKGGDLCQDVLDGLTPHATLYEQFNLTGTVPAGAVTTHYALIGTLFSGSFINVFFDDLNFSFQSACTPQQKPECVPDECSTATPGIDIFPGSCPNAFNVCNSGVITIAILGSDTFDVTDIDVTTLRFADADVRMVGKPTDPKTKCHVVDESGDFSVSLGGDPDSFDDLVCQFNVVDLVGLDDQSLEASIIGNLLDGTPFDYTDTLKITQACN